MVLSMYKDAKVIGTDLSPIQPRWVPPNVEFFVDDAEADWTFKPEFDCIHVRGMAGSIRDWPRLIKQAYNALRPGGYLEVIEIPRFDLMSDDGTYNDRTALWRYYGLVNKASEMAGRSLSLECDFPKIFKEAGFEEYHVTIKSLPMGTWPADKKMKELGQWIAAVYASLPARSLPPLINAGVGPVLVSKRTALAFSPESWGWNWRRQRSCLPTVHRRSRNGLYMHTSISEFLPHRLLLAWKC